MIQICTQAVGRAFEAKDDVQALVDDIERQVFGLAERRLQGSALPIRAILNDTFKHIETLYERKEHITGLATGLVRLDEMTAGLQASDLILIAGRPSMGKTAFALSIAQHIGIALRGRVLILSLEMSAQQLVQRMLSSEGKVNSLAVRTGRLQMSDWNRLTAAAGRLSEAPIFIDDSPGLSVLEVRAKARRLKAEHGLDLIIIDYLQLMRGRTTTESRQQEISEISRSLKALAKELHVPVIALSQLSRAIETRGDNTPRLSDLRESGALEQDADVILFLHRPSRDGDELRRTAEVHIGKQRNGPTGKVEVAFLSDYARFENLADADRQYAPF
jgi:replicative DNA helicase